MVHRAELADASVAVLTKVRETLAPLLCTTLNTELLTMKFLNPFPAVLHRGELAEFGGKRAGWDLLSKWETLAQNTLIVPNPNFLEP